MEANSTKIVKVIGDKAALEDLRRDLSADPVFTTSTLEGTTETRSRQIGFEEVIFAFAVHLPAGMAAHMLYDWLKKWRRRTGKNAHGEGEPK